MQNEVVASLMIRTVSGIEPTARQLELVADLARDTGLDVLRVGRRHVTVAGSTARLSAILGVPVEGQGSTVLNGDESILARYVSTIEIAPTPIIF